MGFIDVLLALPRIWLRFRRAVRAIEQSQPSVVVTIDYPGFNLRLARTLRKRGFTGKLVHYVCPSVWAWGKRRIPLMARTLDLLLCILPFECALFQGTPLKTLFVGNPIAQRVRGERGQEKDAEPLIALFPGSRAHEIRRNLPYMLRACERFPARIAVSATQEAVVRQYLRGAAVELVPASETSALMRRAHFAMAKSGTVTLELALHRVPTVVIYAVSFLDYLIAYHILRIRLPYYALPNVIAGREVFPELIGPRLTDQSLKTALARITLESPRIEQACEQLATQLEDKSPSKEAAQALLPFLLIKSRV
jgi:lipid-A-disaccharide synthase